MIRLPRRRRDWRVDSHEMGHMPLDVFHRQVKRMHVDGTDWTERYRTFAALRARTTTEPTARGNR